jgi:hypothetical protein
MGGHLKYSTDTLYIFSLTSHLSNVIVGDSIRCVDSDGCPEADNKHNSNCGQMFLTELSKQNKL